MSLIKCKECNCQFSDYSEKCPTCGAKTPKKFSTIEWISIGLPVLIAIVFFPRGNDNGTSVSSPAPQESAIQVSASQMAKDYDQNEARGDGLYKGKLLTVTGVVTSIDKDFSDSTVIMLYGLDAFTTVHAEIEKSEEQKAINLEKGLRIAVQCRGQGEVLGSAMLNECIIL